MRSRVISGWIGLSLISVLILVDVLLVTLVAEGMSDRLQVSFLDVGQGDATLIETPTGSQVLIDGGSARSSDRALSDVLPFYDRSIDMILTTHADSDHIGGLVSVLNDYDIDQIIMPIRSADTPAYEAFRQAVKNEKSVGAQVRKLSRGDIVQLGGGAYLVVLFPWLDHSPQDTNDSSLVFKLVYGDTSWLFSGDSPQVIENYLTTTDGRLLDADILKVGHHGSDTSSASQFLSAVSPDIAVISAGADNQYGHPTQSVLNRLQSVGAETVCTCEAGTVTFATDGREVQRIK